MLMWFDIIIIIIITASISHDAGGGGDDDGDDDDDDDGESSYGEDKKKWVNKALKIKEEKLLCGRLGRKNLIKKFWRRMNVDTKRK